MARKTDKRFLASFTKPLFPLEEAHIVSSVNIPPSHHHRKNAPSTSKCYMA